MFFGLHMHVHSCTHWLRPRNPSPPSPHWGSYTRVLLVSQDRRSGTCFKLPRSRFLAGPRKTGIPTTKACPLMSFWMAFSLSAGRAAAWTRRSRPWGRDGSTTQSTPTATYMPRWRSTSSRRWRLQDRRRQRHPRSLRTSNLEEAGTGAAALAATGSWTRKAVEVAVRGGDLSGGGYLWQPDNGSGGGGSYNRSYNRSGAWKDRGESGGEYSQKSKQRWRRRWPATERWRAPESPVAAPTAGTNPAVLPANVVACSRCIRFFVQYYHDISDSIYFIDSLSFCDFSPFTTISPRMNMSAMYCP